MKNFKIIALIPARMGSTRFPGKPLAKILGKPMIGHVYDNVKKNKDINDLVVATCDTEIFDYITSIGGEAVMTSASHKRASDRCSEALSIIEDTKKIEYDIVVMVQGDEPMIDPMMITEAIQPIIYSNDVNVTNLVGDIESKKEFQDPNCIKVVCNLDGNALYFSRQPIPDNISDNKNLMKKQICVIPFRRNFLIKYNKLAPTPLERVESIDMLRILEHGMNVKMVQTAFKTYAVDTPGDLKRVESIISQL